NFDVANNGIISTGFDWFKIGLHRDFTKKLKAFAQYTYFRANNKSMLAHGSNALTMGLANLDVDDVKDFGVGIRYQYTPAIAFQLQYDLRDFGQGIHVKESSERLTDIGMFGKDHVFRFRTELSF
ncbi:MAG: hypothetical protein Q4C78_05130, partial [Synergistaceae bacterium]|nr:hypothetical protein [Synergistaceae bacterium]